MSLIKSISGFRGTIGGNVGDNLTPIDIVSCTAAFGTFVKLQHENPTVVIGRDGRVSGEIVNQLVIQTLRSLGINVVDLGLSTTPTVEIAVPLEKAQAGIIITASHNPKQWNALKFLNHKGEFISAKDGEKVLEILAANQYDFSTVDNLGSYRQDNSYIQKHIDMIFDLELVDVEKVKTKTFKIVVDCINSTGSISVKPLLEQMGCEVILINEEITGNFAHNPEPLKEHLRELEQSVLNNRAHLGIAVDPDVDRLVFMCEDGELFGEEYTIVSLASYILKHKKGNTVSNLSSTRALGDVTRKAGGEYFASAVGEVNVVEMMKEVNAVFGGEGNGGVIYPEFHYGRDALVGIALMLTHLADFGKSISFLRSTYPNYQMSKNKISLDPKLDMDKVFEGIKEKYKREKLTTSDGVKIDFDSGWIHLRKSNTEPIIRIYTEADSQVAADAYAQKIMNDITELIKAKPVN